jgi:hypothetical protein
VGPGGLDRQRLRAGLADLVSVPVDAVEVADDGVTERSLGPDGR